MKKLNLFYLILALNYIYEDPLFATPNRNITWTSNSCWIDSGLQCMTTFHHFNQALQQQALHESSLGYKLRSMLNELKKNSSSPVNVSDFYQSAVGHGIGAHGTGGGDFVPSILFYLLNNNLPEFKKFFRIIEQNKRGEKIVKNDAVKNAEAQKAEIQKGYKIPDNLKFPKTQEEKETKALLIQQRNNILAPFDKIIQENTKKVPLFEYRVSYYTTISNTDEITIKPHNQLTRIIAPLHLLLKLSSEFNQSNIPLKISPYFSRYSYDLQAKGLTTPGHATCMVHDGIENWYFYDDLGKSIKLVNEAKIEDLKYEGKQSDFLYYNRTEKYSVDLEDPLVLSHFARDGNNDQVESILKTSNHDVNQKNEDLFSPLHWAILSEQPEIVEILIDSGANVNAKTISDETPLHFAALVGSTSIIDSLIKQGASIEAINSSNNTPLHYAVKEFNVGAHRTLIRLWRKC
jgi:LysM repeat protein